MTRFPDNPLLRPLAGTALLSLAGALIWVSRTIDWGVAWTVIVPALALAVPGYELVQRRTLAVGDGVLVIGTGLLWRRDLRLPLAGMALEILPTAGLLAVVVHHRGRAWPLRTWTRPGSAERLASWLDAAHPDGAMPRIAAPPPPGDR